MSKAQALRRRLEQPHIVRAVGARDALSAKLVEEAGFDAIWASSFEASASYAVPDASLLTMTQYLDVADSMDAAVSLPVIADCDTGFGGAMNVAYAVQQYERRGIAAICIEDKMFPKMNSFVDARHDLVPIPEFALKLQAGKQAQRSPDFMLIARTEALIAGCGIDEALERAHAYADAQADAVLVHSKSREPDEVLQFAAKWDRPEVPLVAVPTTYPHVDQRTLLEAGFRIVIYANQGLRAAVKAMRGVLSQLSRTDNAAGLEHLIAPMSDVFQLQDMAGRGGLRA